MAGLGDFLIRRAGSSGGMDPVKAASAMAKAFVVAPPKPVVPKPPTPPALVGGDDWGVTHLVALGGGMGQGQQNNFGIPNQGTSFSVSPAEPGFAGMLPQQQEPHMMGTIPITGISSFSPQANVAPIASFRQGPVMAGTIPILGIPAYAPPYGDGIQYDEPPPSETKPPPCTDIMLAEAKTLLTQLDEDDPILREKAESRLRIIAIECDILQLLIDKRNNGVGAEGRSRANAILSMLTIAAAARKEAFDRRELAVWLKLFPHWGETEYLHSFWYVHALAMEATDAAKVLIKDPCHYLLELMHLSIDETSKDCKILRDQTLILLRDLCNLEELTPGHSWPSAVQAATNIRELMNKCYKSKYR